MKHRITHVTIKHATTGYVPINEAAKILNRNHRTLRTWARDGKIRSLTHDRILYIDLGAAALLSKHTPRRHRTPNT